jgi:hypothetical protein
LSEVQARQIRQAEVPPKGEPCEGLDAGQAGATIQGEGSERHQVRQRVEILDPGLVEQMELPEFGQVLQSLQSRQTGGIEEQQAPNPLGQDTRLAGRGKGASSGGRETLENKRLPTPDDPCLNTDQSDRWTQVP